jgi:hypothetical protein
MREPEIYVALATLYLRLCGYFTTGLILHSPKKAHIKSEIDCLAVRLPWHNQTARMVDPPPFLDLRNDQVDLILCEVKSNWPAFNPPIRDKDNLADALRWAGALPEVTIASIVPRLALLLEEDTDRNAAREGIVEGNVRVRALLCSPPLSEADTKLWCLTGDEIFRFIHLCLDISKAPPTCARNYAYELWGQPYDSIVRWFKETKKEEDRTLKALCHHMAD